ncbi:asparagine synthase (glutamine-hydrolyzing) [Sulfitobacter sp. SH22]|uniref:asparagine synthase (glutamine-hydrolyzing) n=1 Tax=Sulfitobacter sp. SH22 TaxID=3421172 RepID=UPI003F501AFF
MCGFCGFWESGTADRSNYNIGLSMADAIASRGPDSTGAITLDQDRLVLAHRRLSIIDTSDAGLQPMVSASGRFKIVYNGEIYNHQALRLALSEEGASPDWHGHSDTETVLACFEALGVEATLSRLEGMFAFAVWDRDIACLTLARDRMGEKPLYYGTIDGVFLFGSDLKAFERHPRFDPNVDRDALTAFIQRSYVPGPSSIYKEIKKLQPGHVINVTWMNSDNAQPEISNNTFWSLKDAIERGRAAPYHGGRTDAATDLDTLLTEVISSQMIADVPLGSFLSGGIDSSLVTAIMQKVGGKPVKTFSIGFDDPQFDESASARSVAEHIGTDHVELIVTPDHLMNIVPLLPDIYSEPFADSSQMPTFLVSELARRHVTVALTGDGADEIFGGYNRYLAAGKIWKHTSKVPTPIRRALGHYALAVSRANWDRLFNSLAPVLPPRLRVRMPGEKIHKIGRLLKQRTRQKYYESLISMVDNSQALVIGGEMPLTIVNDAAAQPETDSFEHWMMAVDALTYLPDDICAKVDRASMANSLETRAPFLDRRIVEFAWRLPLDYKIVNGRSKQILRDVLSNYVPRSLFERPKMGFGVPFGHWLRGPMRDWAEHLLSEERLKEDGFFDPDAIRAAWAAHLAGKGSNEYMLWNVLVFNAWLDRWHK